MVTPADAWGAGEVAGTAGLELGVGVVAELGVDALTDPEVTVAAGLLTVAEEAGDDSGC